MELVTKIPKSTPGGRGENLHDFNLTFTFGCTWITLLANTSHIPIQQSTEQSPEKKNFIWVSRYFARKYYYFYVSNWKRDRHFTWSSEPREGLAACSAKEVPSFLSHFKTLSNCPAPGIEPATSRSAVKRSTDWAIPATDKNYLPPLIHFYSLSHEDDWVKSCINNVLLNKCLNRLSIVWSRKK